MEERVLGIPTDVLCEENDKVQYQPSRNECLRNFNINIRFLSIGCIVEVGCMFIPFSSIDEAIDAIKAYVKDPYEERKAWEKVIEISNK